MAIISVFGSANPTPDSADYAAAKEVGSLLAQAGFTVQTGGYAGVMAGASQGANEAGGHVIGITCTQIEAFRPVPPNQWVLEEIKYPTLRERLFHVIEQCQGAIVMPGGIGTLGELALMWNLVQTGEISPRPVVAVGSLWAQTLDTFNDPTYIRAEHGALIKQATTPTEAVHYIVNTLR